LKKARGILADVASIFSSIPDINAHFLVVFYLISISAKNDKFAKDEEAGSFNENS
jgi:hypothetical protein